MEKQQLIFILILCSISAVHCVDWDEKTPLDKYVHLDDGYFRWEEVASYNYEGCTVYVVNMTSQLYQSDTFSTRSIWWHYMGIAIPDNLVYPDAAFMFIDGGGNENYNPPSESSNENVAIAFAARDTGIISSYIRSVPNQPFYFHNDPTLQRRTEDAIIAWTWRTYMDMPEPKDPTVVLRMPMTKAAKRGLDTINAVVDRKLPGTNVTRFIVTGFSKRGWTTWSVAAVDKRVVAIVPVVFSLINMDAAVMSHNRNMDGDWSFALGPYWRENLTQEFHNPAREGVWESEDMYNYKERFTIPILAVSGSGDEFFLPDDNHNWWDDFPDNKHLLMLPNAEHTLAPHYPKIYETAISFAQMSLAGASLPKMSWQMGNTSTGGFIRLTTDPPPNTIRAWRAVTLDNGRRDFRLAAGAPGSIAAQLIPWRPFNDVRDLGDGEYYWETTIVKDRWVGFFLEGIWEGLPGVYSYRIALTTQVNIIPWTHPTEACVDRVTCWGKLV